MPYDEALGERVRAAVGRRRGITEKKMFGGLAFMLHGNMWCGVEGRDLVVRVGPEAYDKARRRAHARPMDFTGKPLRGFIYVSSKGCATSASLRSWLDLAYAYVSKLPRK